MQNEVMVFNHTLENGQKKKFRNYFEINNQSYSISLDFEDKNFFSIVIISSHVKSSSKKGKKNNNLFLRHIDDFQSMFSEDSDNYEKKIRDFNVKNESRGMLIEVHRIKNRSLELPKLTLSLLMYGIVKFYFIFF
jgi:hypothetical protein